MAKANWVAHMRIGANTANEGFNLRIQPLDAHDKASNRFRRRAAIRVESPAELLEFVAFPVFFFQPRQYERKDIEILDRIGHGVCDFTNSIPIMNSERAAAGHGGD